MASTSAAAKHEFIVILPDNDGALAERMKVRPTHLANIKAKTGNFWLLGGAYLDDVPKDGESPNIKGSVMLAIAESKEQVLEELKKDVYYSAVWDLNKIHPFRSAIREPL